MDRIRFKGSETIFEGKISRTAHNMLHVQLSDKSAAKGVDTSEIEVLTAQGKTIAKYAGFSTVFSETDNGFVLSNDGTVYTEHEEPAEDIEAIRTAKLAEVSNRCESTIFAGTDVQLSDGSVEHISLTEKDQLNLFGKQAQLAAGATQCEYHEDGQLCKYYSAEDMKIMTETALKYVSFHTTYCNSLNAWIKGTDDAEEIKAIQYGDEIPAKFKSEVLKDYEAAQNA